MPATATSTCFGNEVIVSGYSEAQPDDAGTGSADQLGRRRVGILYADIAAYSRMSEADEEGTHLRLIESMKIMDSFVCALNGRIVHTADDVILAECGDVGSALLCAVKVQLAAREINARLPMNQQVLFRIGVNFGDVISDNGEIYGNAVNLTARLEKLAESGGICVSESVRAELEGKSDFRFVALGKQYVKNISEPVQAFWIEIDAHRVVSTGVVEIPSMVS